MRELIEFLVKNLVNNPETVKITETTKGDLTEFHIEVSEDDIGAVIGKGGRIANAIRTVARASAKKNDVKINIKFN